MSANAQERTTMRLRYGAAAGQLACAAWLSTLVSAAIADVIPSDVDAVSTRGGLVRVERGSGEHDLWLNGKPIAGTHGATLKLKQQFHFTDSDVLVVDKSIAGSSSSSSTLFILTVTAAGDARVSRLPVGQEMATDDADRLEVAQHADSLDIKTLKIDAKGVSGRAYKFSNGSLDVDPKVIWTAAPSLAAASVKTTLEGGWDCTVLPVRGSARRSAFTFAPSGDFRRTVGNTTLIGTYKRQGDKADLVVSKMQFQDEVSDYAVPSIEVTIFVDRPGRLVFGAASPLSALSEPQFDCTPT